MEKLRDAVIRLATEEQKKPLSSSQIALIDRRLHLAFPLGIRTPAHPTYAAMILKAIEELSEEGGSSEESISEYMKANYDLPWAHKSYLNNHLDKLCEKGGIVIMANNRYTIPGFTPKSGVKRRRPKRKLGLKQTLSCHEKSREEENTCEMEELRLVNVKKMRSGRSVLIFQEKGKLLGLNSHRTKDDHVRNGCGNQVVIKDQDELKQQEGEMFGKEDELEEDQNKVTNVGIVDKANHPGDKVEGNCEQLLIEDSERIEERSLLNECREKKFSAMEDDSNGAHLMITPNKGESFENLVNGKKEDAIKLTGKFIICGLAAGLPKPKQKPKERGSKSKEQPERQASKSKERQKRQASKAKEQPKKLISHVGPSPNSKLRKHGNEQGNSSLGKSKSQRKKLISPIDPFPNSELYEHESEQGTSSMGKSKSRPKKLVSPVGPFPNSELCSHENPQGNSSISMLKEQPEKLAPPIDPVPSSNLPEHENQQGNSTTSYEDTKVKWPSWVQSLLDASFFGQCKVHAEVSGSVCNSYCLDCKNRALCASCLASHEDHNVIKIRQSMFEDAIDVSAIEKHVDITGIHAQKVSPTDTTIVLNRMISASWHHFSGNSSCRQCQRRVPEPFYFCSLSCKFAFEL